jgi:UTP--glucose-1-phosphate uridylyltransferase
MNTQVKKAVIPAAGFGTRMLPAAKAVPKELLPILDRPTIQHVVEEAAAAGIADVLLISSRKKPALEQHFLPNDELNQRLRKSGKSDLLASVDSLMAKIKIHLAYQPQQRGLGDAVNQARDHVGNEPFLVMLGDAVFSGGILPARQLIDAHARFGTAIVGLQQVPPEKVSRYGIVGGQMIEPGVIRIDQLVEKPSPSQAPSHYAIAARYLLTPAIFDCLDATAADSSGEIQLTDAMQMMLAREPIHGIVLQAERHDIGNPIDWLKTNLIFAAHDPKFWNELSPLIESLLRK